MKTDNEDNGDPEKGSQYTRFCSKLEKVLYTKVLVMNVAKTIRPTPFKIKEESLS